MHAQFAGPVLTAGYSTSPPGKADFENAFKKRKLLELSGDHEICSGRTAGSLEVPNTFPCTALAPASPESPAKEVYTGGNPAKSTLEQRSDAAQIDDGYRYSYLLCMSRSHGPYSLIAQVCDSHVWLNAGIQRDLQYGDLKNCLGPGGGNTVKNL